MPLSGADVAKDLKENGKGEYKRLHVRFPPQAVEQLDQLKAELGASSYVEVIKIALGLLDWAVDRLKKGWSVEARHGESERERIVLPSISSVH